MSYQEAFFLHQTLFSYYILKLIKNVSITSSRLPNGVPQGFLLGPGHFSTVKQVKTIKHFLYIVKWTIKVFSAHINLFIYNSLKFCCRFMERFMGVPQSSLVAPINIYLFNFRITKNVYIYNSMLSNEVGCIKYLMF